MLDMWCVGNEMKRKKRKTPENWSVIMSTCHECSMPLMTQILSPH